MASAVPARIGSRRAIERTFHGHRREAPGFGGSMRSNVSARRRSAACRVLATQAMSLTCTIAKPEPTSRVYGRRGSAPDDTADRTPVRSRTTIAQVQSRAAVIPRRSRSDSVLANGDVPLELIVVNDGSTDDSALVLESYGARITAVTQPNQGAANALNRGIRAASAEFVCWLSADDEFLPGKIRTQVDFLESHPEVGMCCTGFVVIDALDRVVRHERAPRWPHPDPFVAVFWRNPINGSTVMLRRAVFDDVGPFDERLPADVDADMWMRIALRWEIRQIEGEYVRYRVHGASLSSNRPLMRSTMTEVRQARIDDGSLMQRALAAGGGEPELFARMST